MFINGSSPYTGLADFASLDTVVRMEALTAQQFSNCPAWVIDPLKQYIATLRTSKGDLVIQLFPDKAPWRLITLSPWRAAAGTMVLPSLECCQVSCHDR